MGQQTRRDNKANYYYLDLRLLDGEMDRLVPRPCRFTASMQQEQRGCGGGENQLLQLVGAPVVGLEAFKADARRSLWRRGRGI